MSRVLAQAGRPIRRPCSLAQRGARDDVSAVRRGVPPRVQHVLKTLREVANAVRYALENFRHHFREDVAPQGADPCSSARWLGASDDAPILSPRTWLLRHVPDAFTSSPPERGVPAGVAARESRQV